MNANQYWMEVRKVEQCLPAGNLVWITSIEDQTTNMKGGITDASAREFAARWIFEKKYRLATLEEIAAAKALLETMTQQDLARERMRKSENRLQLTPELLSEIMSPKRK